MSKLTKNGGHGSKIGLSLVQVRLETKKLGAGVNGKSPCKCIETVLYPRSVQNCTRSHFIFLIEINMLVIILFIYFSHQIKCTNIQLGDYERDCD